MGERHLAVSVSANDGRRPKGPDARIESDVSSIKRDVSRIESVFHASSIAMSQASKAIFPGIEGTTCTKIVLAYPAVSDSSICSGCTQLKAPDYI
jgi:hypothetical protein